MSAMLGRRGVFLSYGFRPFFLFAGLYAVMAMAAWLVWLLLLAGNVTVAQPTIAEAPHLWHAHEMLFGYAGAAVTGFLLTAVPNWTGAAPVAGMRLGFLVAVWLAGRLVMWFSAFLPGLLVAAVDLAHLPVLAVMVGMSLMQRPAPRNLVFLGFLALLAFANAAVHAEWTGYADDIASWGLRLGIVVFVLMVIIIGGRVVPAFTRNALMRRGRTEALPRGLGWLEALSVLTVVAVVVAAAIDWTPGLGAAALAAGMANAWRLGLWRPLASFDEPIVWSLHLGYLSAVAGFLALAGADLGGWPSETAALHILAIGAVGGMTLAIMTRAALGHTGRALTVARPVVAAYGLVSAAALVRGFGVQIMPEHYFAVIAVAGMAWMLAFALFIGVYFSILVGPPGSGDGNT
jgi:uncharacterized protein involved in response to NO